MCLVLVTSVLGVAAHVWTWCVTIGTSAGVKYLEFTVKEAEELSELETEWVSIIHDKILGWDVLGTFVARQDAQAIPIDVLVFNTDTNGEVVGEKFFEFS